MNESYTGRINRKLGKKLRVVAAAAGRAKADLVLKNATYVNVFSNELCTGDIACYGGLVVGIGEYSGEREIDMTGKIVCPGFIDAHIHLESSLVTPGEFAKAVLPHGTTTVVTDPHEIANVMGVDGIEYMLQATEGLPVDVRFMLPSCVPASPMDESGANLNYFSIDSFYEHPRVMGLAEMMNYPGVIRGDVEAISKILASQAHHKKIDGHAPGLSGKDLNAYVAAGVYSDHECSTIEDAMEKLRVGQFIMIREGTAAHNLEALAPLLKKRYYDRCMFCSDDKHPNDLLFKGHIDDLVRMSINTYGVDPIIAVKVACHNAARYFLLNNRGAIAPGYLADFAVVDNFENFHVEMVIKKGEIYCMNGQTKPFEVTIPADYLVEESHDTFHVVPLSAENFADHRKRGVIGMVAHELVTTDNGYAEQIDTQKDILKMAVVERHHYTRHIGIGYLQGYGMQTGAVATSISHDSHNIIVVGTNESDMAVAANRIVENHGGICVVKDGVVTAELVLPIAGLMSEEPLEKVNELLEHAKEVAYAQGVARDIDPFMTLSFMSLPVIPTLRLTTRGVFDVERQGYI